MKKSKVVRKRTKKLVILSFYLNCHFFYKKPKELTIKKLSEELPFFTKRKKKTNKYQIPSNILPFFDTVGIVKNEHVHRVMQNLIMLKLWIIKA